MGAVMRNAVADGAPGWLELPPAPGVGLPRDLVGQALEQAILLGGPDLPSSVVLATGSWRLDLRELRAVVERLGDRGVALVGLISRDPQTRVAGAALGLPWATPATTHAASQPEAIQPGLSIHQGTVRAGDQVETEGSLLVLGDVNPGASVRAGGHVLVWGRLRGTAHAGAMGDLRARIVALQLRPLQLRIASAVARGPEDLPPTGFAEQAVLVDGMIQLEPAAATWPL